MQLFTKYLPLSSAHFTVLKRYIKQKGGFRVSADLQDQYDKIFRYCCLKVNNPVIAEDITQETFLRYLENPRYHGSSDSIKLLYTIAGNLCTDEFRKKQTLPLPEDLPDDKDCESVWNENISLKNALDSFSEKDRELVLLRYVNEVPLSVMSRIYDMSRFSLSRRLKKILSILKNSFEKEDRI